MAGESIIIISYRRRANKCGGIHEWMHLALRADSLSLFRVVSAACPHSHDGGQPGETSVLFSFARCTTTAVLSLRIIYFPPVF